MTDDRSSSREVGGRVHLWSHQAQCRGGRDGGVTASSPTPALVCGVASEGSAGCRDYPLSRCGGPGLLRSAEPRRLAHDVFQPLADRGAHGIGSAQRQLTVESGGDVGGHPHLGSERLGRPFFDPGSDDQQSRAIAGDGLASNGLVIRHQEGDDCSGHRVDSRGGGGCHRRTRVGFSASGLHHGHAREGAVTGPSPQFEIVQQLAQARRRRHAELGAGASPRRR